jgi:hypothetical protein
VECSECVFGWSNALGALRLYSRSSFFLRKSHQHKDHVCERFHGNPIENHIKEGHTYTHIHIPHTHTHTHTTHTHTHTHTGTHRHTPDSHPSKEDRTDAAAESASEREQPQCRPESNHPDPVWLQVCLVDPCATAGAGARRTRRSVDGRGARSRRRRPAYADEDRRSPS